MGKHQKDKFFSEDGTRPIETGNLEIVDTFSVDGVRPVAKGPIKLIPNTDSDLDDAKEKSSQISESTSNDSSSNQPLNRDNKERVKSGPAKENSKGEIDGDRPVNTSGKKVVDTFVDDGTRPIMKDDYEVVATLNIDGERPITSQQ